jgi:hypothetical protein
MAKDNDGYPKTCAICGQKIVKSRDGSLGFYFDHTGGPHLSWHYRCGGLAAALATRS